MIPLRDDQPTSTFPIVTIIIIVLNVVVYLAQQVLPLDHSWVMVPYEITHRQDLANVVIQFTSHGPVQITVPPDVHSIALRPNEEYLGPSPHPLWLTIFTAMFMHANLLHIGGNMLFFWIFGNNIEDALGKVRFLLFYLACGVAAAFTQIAIDPNSVIPSLGASGAIAGILGAYLILYPDARVLSIVPIFGFGFLAQVRAFWVLLVWVAVDIVPGFLQIGMQNAGGVGYFAHLGGFVTGLILIQILGGKRLVARQKRRFYAPPPSGGGGYY